MHSDGTSRSAEGGDGAGRLAPVTETTAEPVVPCREPASVRNCGLQVVFSADFYSEGRREF